MTTVESNGAIRFPEVNPRINYYQTATDTVSKLYDLKNLYFPSGKTISKVEVEEGCSIYVEESGNPHGIPVVFVHGGPGIEAKGDGWFNPDLYRIIVFQQRGTVHCQPSAADIHTDASIFKDVTIQTLAEDMEVLRKKLNIDKWLVFGGSWGSTLSLFYAQNYPISCSGLVLRGVYLGTDEENRSFFCDKDLRERLQDHWNPKALEEMANYAKEQGCTIDMNDHRTLYSAYRELVVDKNDLVAARKWVAYENYIDNPSNEQLFSAVLCRNSRVGLLPEDRCKAVWETLMFDSVAKTINLLNKERMDNLKGMPIQIVQGALDTLCPKEIAQKLVSELSAAGSKVTFNEVEHGAHTPYSPEMTDALVRATDNFAELLKNKIN